MAADYGIKISRDGFDVASATARQLAFTSKYPMFKEFMSGTGNITLPGTDVSVTVTITHSLGYRPAFFLFINMPAGTVLSSALEGVYKVPNRNGQGFYHAYGLSKTNTLDIKVRNTPASGTSKTFGYKYYIMVDKAET